jgi:hypothetical protein
MTKPERLGAAVLALTAVFALYAYAKAVGLGATISALLAEPAMGGRLFALAAVMGASLLLGLTVSLVLPLWSQPDPIEGFRPAGASQGGLAPAPAKYRPPLPGRYGNATTSAAERQFAELPRPGYSKPMIVHHIYPQAPFVKRLDQAHLYWAMRLLSEKRGRDLRPRGRAAPPRKKPGAARKRTAKNAPSRLTARRPTRPA